MDSYSQAYRASKRIPPVLLPGTLARFASPQSWQVITKLNPRQSSTWWRAAIIDAEARGLLWWDRWARGWCLTDAGRELVRDVA